MREEWNAETLRVAHIECTLFLLIAKLWGFQSDRHGRAIDIALVSVKDLNRKFDCAV